MDDEVREVFNKFDKNGNGKISCSELKEMLVMLGSKTTSEEVKLVKEDIDKNKDGYIDLKEFAVFHYTDTNKNDSMELGDAFDLYDLDKNDLISANELHAVLRKLGEKCFLNDCQRMISNVDANGDGNINFEEFKKMMSCS